MRLNCFRYYDFSVRHEETNDVRSCFRGWCSLLISLHFFTIVFKGFPLFSYFFCSYVISSACEIDESKEGSCCCIPYPLP